MGVSKINLCTLSRLRLAGFLVVTAFQQTLGVELPESCILFL